jgi:hypothetical protein
MNDNRIRRAGEDQDLTGQEAAQAFPCFLIAGQGREADGGHEGMWKAEVVVELPADGGFNCWGGRRGGGGGSGCGGVGRVWAIVSGRKDDAGG